MNVHLMSILGKLQNIKTLHNLYRLNEEELNILLKKIDEKIRIKI